MTKLLFVFMLNKQYRCCLWMGLLTKIFLQRNLEIISK